MKYSYGNAEIVGHVPATGQPIINMEELIAAVKAATQGETTLKVIIPSEGSPFVCARDYVVTGAYYPPMYLTRWEAEQLAEAYATGNASSGWNRDVATLDRDCYSWKAFPIQL